MGTIFDPAANRYQPFIWRAGKRLTSLGFCVLIALLLAFSLVRAVMVTQACLWPPEWDLLRDVGTAQVIIEGRYPEDPILLNETLWFNPLTGALLAGVHWVSGIDLPRLGVLLGPYINLLTPLAFALLVGRLFGRTAALAGLCMVLYGKHPANPFWLQLCYAPWLMAPLYAPGLMFLTLAAWYKGLATRSAAVCCIAGLLLGITFTAHTAPAVVAGGAMLLHVLVESGRLIYTAHCDQNTKGAAWKNGNRQAFRLVSLFVLLLLVAFLVSLPYTWHILWNYGFRVRNPRPSLYAVDFVALQYLPARLAEALNWRNALALLGVGALVHRLDLPSRLVLCWAITASLLMTHHYLLQWLLHTRDIVITGLAPGHHWALYLSAVRGVCFAIGAVTLGAGLAWSLQQGWRGIQGGMSRNTFLRLRRVCMMLAACAAGAALYLANPLTTRADFQPPHMTLYHQLHQRHISMYTWIVSNTPPDAVFLCFEDAVAMTVVMPAARKLLFPMAIYSNPYVERGPQSQANLQMLEASRQKDPELFCKKRARYTAVYVLIRANAPPAINPLFYTEVYRVGDLILYEAVSCEDGAVPNLSSVGIHNASKEMPT